MGNWQRAQDSSAPRPDPLVPPGETSADVDSYGSEPVTVAEFDDWWNTN